MEMVAALLICGAIGGLCFVLLTLFKKYQDLVETQQTKAIEAQRETLKITSDAQTEALTKRLEQLMEAHSELIKKHHADELRHQKALTDLQSKLDFDSIRELLEHISKVGEIKVVSELLPLVGHNRETTRAIEFAMSFLKNHEVIQGMRGLMQSTSKPLLGDTVVHAASTAAVTAAAPPAPSFLPSSVQSAAAAAAQVPVAPQQTPIAEPVAPAAQTANPSLDQAAAAEIAANETDELRLAAEAIEKQLAQEAENLRLQQESEQQRLAQEAEAARLAKEQEEQRLAQEAEAARLAKEQEEQRLAAEQEQQRLAAELEAQQRQAAEAEQARLAAEAEQTRLAEEAEERRQAEEIERQIQAE
ncbi:MAG: hypothetical protein K2X81_05205, partial [Candidatus Obscuribacterales bacterium]|nr:hypothetical protein [Candidatus Obscuribacterales bacterium]